MSEQKAEKDRVPKGGKETGQWTKPDAQPSEQPVIGQETNPDGAQPTEIVAKLLKQAGIEK